MRESKAKPNEGIPVFRGEPITVLEAEEKYRIGKDWFYRHMRNGTLPFPWFMRSVGNRVMDNC